MAQTLDLTGHPCHGMDETARAIFERVIEYGSVRSTSLEPPKSFVDLENAGCICIRGEVYNWHAHETMDAWERYGKWLDAHPEYETASTAVA